MAPGTVALSGYYLSRPDLETLYGGLNAQDVSRIGATLKEAGIAFDVNAQGTAVLVRRLAPLVQDVRSNTCGRGW